MMLLDGDVGEGILKLVTDFKILRSEAKPDEWAEFSEKGFLAHPCVRLVHEDPFTHHAFTQPRGYSGDAELIDYMYRIRQPPAEISKLGRAIFRLNTQVETTDVSAGVPAPESVRERRKIIAEMIDEMAEVKDNLRILSIACGHLREAHISKAVKEEKIGKYFALDQDASSLGVVSREFAGSNVQTVHASIKSLFTNGHNFTDMDFVYAAGLFDYLTEPVAIRLAARVFEMLRPGGKLLVANFAPCLRDIGYMETFMRWKLIYRNEADVADFARCILENEVENQRLFWDNAKNVIYLEITKK